MTGTGSQTDPYIVSSWIDFRGIHDASAYYKLAANLDANDYNNGVWDKMDILAAEIDGCGYTVRNIICLADNAFRVYTANSPIKLKNTGFENCHCPSSAFISASMSGCNITFENCHVDAITKGLAYTVGGSKLIASECSFSIKTSTPYAQGLVSYVYASDMPTFTNCQIYHEWQNSIGQYGSVFNNCRLDGRWVLSPTYQITICASNSVIIPIVSGGPILNINGALPSVMCSNRGNITVSSGRTIVGTTAQLNSAAWLQAQGFECVEV